MWVGLIQSFEDLNKTKRLTSSEQQGILQQMAFMFELKPWLSSGTEA